MHLLNNFKIILSLLLLSFSIQIFADETTPYSKILDYHISKVKQAYIDLEKKYKVCFNQEDNNTITIFNYDNPNIKGIDIFKFVDYIYIRNQDACYSESFKNLSYEMFVLRSLFNEYNEKGNLYLDSIINAVALNIFTETKFKTKEKYKSLPEQTKRYLEETLGKTPFNIKPFRETYTKKLEQERELKLKK